MEALLGAMLIRKEDIASGMLLKISKSAVPEKFFLDEIFRLTNRICIEKQRIWIFAIERHADNITVRQGTHKVTLTAEIQAIQICDNTAL